MKIKTSCLAFLSLILFISSVSFASDGNSPSLTNAQYKEALRAFIKEVDKTYPFFEIKKIGPDWQRCKRKLMTGINKCQTNNDFYILLDDARRCLRDAHMSFFDLKGQYPRQPQLYTPGIALAPAVDKQVVIMGAAKEYNDLEPGTVVKLINNMPARKFLDYQAKEDWQKGGHFSSPQRARLFTYRIPLQTPKDTDHVLTIVHNGNDKQVAVTSKYPAGGWQHTFAMPKNLIRNGNCQFGKLESGYGYIYLRRISSDLIESIDKALQSFGDIKGLIIDLRGNGGGGYNSEVFKRFDKKLLSDPPDSYYNGPMVVLIDAGTISAGETFARDLVNTAGAYLMGEPTAGSSTSKRYWNIPHALGKVRFSTRSRWGFKRKPIEYYGIRPNKKVEVVPAELQQGINSAIKRAEEYLDKKNSMRKRIKNL